MRFGNLQAQRGQKSYKCVQCEEEIEPKTLYVALTYKGKLRGWWSRKFHLHCLPNYIVIKHEEERVAPKKGSAGAKGGRPRLDIDPKRKKRRRVLLQYLNTLDIRSLVEAYENNGNIDKVKVRMLKRIDELEKIGVAYPSPFLNRKLNETLREYDPELYADLSATTVWVERIEILRGSING